MEKKEKSIVISLIVGLIFVVYLISPIICSFDSHWSIHTAMSILKEGNTDLDEYVDIESAQNDYRLEIVNGHYYSYFPVGASLVALPFVYLFDKAFYLFQSSFPDFLLFKYLKKRLDYEVDILALTDIHRSVELVISSFIVTLTAIFVFKIAHLSLSMRYSIFIMLVFAFCTSAWSVASRGLWQHGPSMLMLSIALYILLISIKENTKLIQFVSIPLVFSYIIRPTNSISIIILSVFVLLQYRRYFLRYLLWGSVIAVPFLAYNLTIYGSLLSPYYLPQRIGMNGGFLLALAGNLISPARGLIVYSPVFLFSFLGIYLKYKYHKIEKLDWYLAGIIVLHWISISLFPHWWGGYSYGPRFFSDVIPYFIYFIIQAFKMLPNLKSSKIAFISFSILAILSIFIHFRGATDWDVYRWNTYPSDIDGHPERLWDWSDPQFLRGL